MIKKVLSITLLSSLSLPEISLACGTESDCPIGDRHYRVRMPEGYEAGTKIGAIVFAHGFGGSAKGLMNNQGMTDLSNELGLAVIAAKSAAKDWSIPGAPSKVTFENVDELAYFDAVIADAALRFPIDAERLLMTGFSAGGMMVWNLACFRSESFAAFAPMAGTFWHPEPVSCDTPPANIIHIHGTEDKTVPMDGREVLDTRQGNVASVVEMYRSYGGYRRTVAEDIGSLACETSLNDDGQRLSLCIFEGGHTFKTDYIRHVWATFEAAGKL